jgi:glycosyltransferase involved in cell wall biosynthesis
VNGVAKTTKPKIGWLSAPITATTGYGKVSMYILMLLADMGFEVVNIGGRGTAVTWGEKVYIKTGKGSQILCLPCWGQVGDRNTLEYYVRRYGIDVLVSLWDSFVLEPIGRPSVPYAAYIPVDSPMTNKMAGYLLNADLIVAYSIFGYEQLQKKFPPFLVKYIPHGIDTKVFKPAEPDERDKFRDEWGLPKDAFIYLFVGANMGERKCIPQLMLTYAKLAARHPDWKTRLYLYTNMFTPYPQGYALADLAQTLGIEKTVMGPAFNTILDSVEDENLAHLYACADVTVNPSLGEGFGMAVLESEACSTPVIATNNSSMRELVEDHGWLIDTVSEDVWVDVPVWVPTLQQYNPPNLTALLACMEDAYNSPDNKRQWFGRLSREFALQYDWDKLMPGWENLITELAEIRKTTA